MTFDFREEALRGLTVLRDVLDRLIGEGMAQRSAFSDATTESFAVDLCEQDEHFVLLASLPGIKPEDISIQAHENRITIRGLRRLSDEGTFHLREHQTATLERAVDLPVGIDARQAHARLEYGLLTLTLPKAAPVQVIPLSSEEARDEIDIEADESAPKAEGESASETEAAPEAEVQLEAEGAEEITLSEAITAELKASLEAEEPAAEEASTAIVAEEPAQEPDAEEAGGEIIAEVAPEETAAEEPAEAIVAEESAEAIVAGDLSDEVADDVPAVEIAAEEQPEAASTEAPAEEAIAEAIVAEEPAEAASEEAAEAEIAMEAESTEEPEAEEVMEPVVEEHAADVLGEETATADALADTAEMVPELLRADAAADNEDTPQMQVPASDAA